jgi:hypothetical protein
MGNYHRHMPLQIRQITLIVKNAPLEFAAGTEQLSCRRRSKVKVGGVVTGGYAITRISMDGSMDS